MRLLEREAELASLSSAWESAGRGAGRLVVVQGAAGNGKSALLAAAAEQAAGAGVQVLRARGSDLERDFVFGAVRQLFEPVVAGLSSARRARLLAGAAGPAARVVAPENASGSLELTADGAFAVLNGIYWLTTNLAQRTPVALIVDDLHWVDPSSVRALAYLAHRIADLPLAMVVALRPAEPDSPVALLDELRAEPEAARITLAALNLGSVAAIVRAAIPGADEALCAACYSATAGNPFYLRELLVTVAAESQQRGSGAAVSEVAVPTLGDRIIRRLARIGPPAVALGQAMSVLGDGSRLTHAAALAGLDEPAAASAAAAMRRMEVLAAADPVAFVHPLVSRSLYDTLSVADRDTAHMQAARRLRAAGASPEAVAVHLAAARPAAQSSVAAALREAARIAMRQGAPDTASRWLARALAENAAEPPRAALLHDLGRVELASRNPMAITHLREALDLAADPVAGARVALDLAEILGSAGQWQSSLAVMSDALASIGEGDPDLVVDLEALRAVVSANDPRLASAFDADRARLLQLAAGPGWPARALAVTIANTWVMRGDSLPQARALVEDGLRAWQLFSERGAGGWASAQALMALTLLDADERAAEVIDELAIRAAEAGSLIGTLTAMGYRSWLATRRGDLAMAEADMRTCIDVSLQNGMQLLVVTGLKFLVDAILERPSLDDVAVMAEQVELTPDFQETCGGGMLLEVRGRLRVERGDRDGGITELRACERVHRGLGFGPPYSFWRSALALALAPQAPDEALSLMKEELELAAATGLPRAHGIALRCAGLLAGSERGLGYLRDAVELLAGSAARLEHARALVDFGAALRRTGQRVDARELLSAGLELAHRCGAERLTGRALEEMRAAGARPRRIVRTGLDSLTASELRTARLVSEGRSNAEVAQALFVSLKTVETHLSHAYAKLSLAGPGARRQLGAILRDQPRLVG